LDYLRKDSLCGIKLLVWDIKKDREKEKCQKSLEKVLLAGSS
jgi:hypothetical protein